MKIWQLQINYLLNYSTRRLSHPSLMIYTPHENPFEIILCYSKIFCKQPERLEFCDKCSLFCCLNESRRTIQTSNFNSEVRNNETDSELQSLLSSKVPMLHN